jgi:hypothetical protein
MTRISRVATALVVLGLGACKSLEVPSVQIPDGSIQYVFSPTSLFYDYIDTTAGIKLHLTYLPQQPYAGTNCIALSPNNGTDTVGSFVFAFRGANNGGVLRVDHGSIDTTTFILLTGQEGNHGSYVLHSNGTLNMTWADWPPHRSRFFVDSAQIRIIGDSIASDVVNEEFADSVHAIWHVRWVRGTCG